MNKTRAFSWLVIFISICIIFWGLSTPDKSSDSVITSSVLNSNESSIPAIDNRTLKPDDVDISASVDMLDKEAVELEAEIIEQKIAELKTASERIAAEQAAAEQAAAELAAAEQAAAELAAAELAAAEQAAAELAAAELAVAEQAVAEQAVAEQAVAEQENKLIETDDITVTSSTKLSINEIIQSRVEEWRVAWQTGDVDSYFRVYSSNFVPSDNVSLTDWQASRREKVNPSREIFINVNNIQLSLDETKTKSTVLFDQEYMSSNYSDVSRKQLDMVLEDNQWRILVEKTVN